MDNTPSLWGREPALFLGLANAVLAVVVGFGLPVTPEQVGLVNALVAAIIAFAVRSQVNPMATIVERLQGKQVIAGPANDMAVPGEVVRSVVERDGEA